MSLTAEQAFLLFAIESTRFKAASVVKQNKFGAVYLVLVMLVKYELTTLQLSQHLKEIRTKSAAALLEISTSLIRLAESDASSDGRAVIVNACKPIIHDSGVRLH